MNYQIDNIVLQTNRHYTALDSWLLALGSWFLALGS